MKQKNNNLNKKGNINNKEKKNINENINKKNKDINEMLLSKYIANEIDFIDEIYNVSIYDINFIRSFFWNNPVKKEKGVLKKNNKYIDKKTKEHIESLIELMKKEKKLKLEELIKKEVIYLGYDYDSDDSRDIERNEIMIRRELEKDLYFIAGYLKEKLNKQFITKRISKDNISLKLLVKRYNRSLARLKYLFYYL